MNCETFINELRHFKVMPNDQTELEDLVESPSKEQDSENRKRRRADILEDLRDKSNRVESASEVVKLVLDTLSERGYKGTRMWAKDGEKYKLIAAADFPNVLLEKEPSFIPNNGLLEKILQREGKSTYFKDATKENTLMTGPFDPLNSVLARYPQAVNMLAFPYSSFSNLKTLKDFKGLMVVNYDPADPRDIELDENGKVSSNEDRFLGRIAKWVVADKVVRMMELNREGLTGLYEVTKFHRDWHRYVNRFHLTGETQGLITIDIDHFKEINDTYGHLVGDEFIQGLGKMFRGMESKDIRLYHPGGDEFAVIVRGNIEYVKQLGEEILQKVKTVWVPKGAEPRTASIGIAMTEPSIMNGEEWAKGADDAVYMAKENGRNQVCIYQK
jgi:diguanylate cyclase (GGDEF)-like protein